MMINQIFRNSIHVVDRLKKLSRMTSIFRINIIFSSTESISFRKVGQYFLQAIIIIMSTMIDPRMAAAMIPPVIIVPDWPN